MHKKLIYAAILLLLPLAIFLPIGLLDLRFEEPRRGLVALEMMLRHNYVVPTIHGWVYLNKPPLFNWLIILSANCTGGLTEWAVRLPSLLALFALALLHFFVARRWVRNRTAAFSALFLITVGDIFFFETVISGEIDLFYALVVYAQLICIFVGFQHKNYALLFLGSCLLMAAGVLTKGLPSLLFQAFTLLAWAGYQRRWRWLFHPWHFAGIGLAALVLGGYGYAYAQQANLPLFITKLFMEASEKSGAQSSWTDVILAPLTYPFLLLKFLLPWCLLLPFLLVKAVRKTLFSNPLLAFAILVIGVNILPYAFTSYPKSRYIYMLYPFMTLLLAHGYFSAGQQLKKYQRFLTVLLGGLMVVVLVALPVLCLVPPTNTVPNLWVGLLPVGLGMLLTLWAYHKQWANSLAIFVLFLCLTRLAYNAISFPLVKKSDSLQLGQHARAIAAIAKNETIYYFDVPDTLRPKGFVPRLLGWRQPELVPPFITYSIPYYITKSTTRIMPFTNILQTNRLYLSPAKLVQVPQARVLYRFVVKNRQIEYLLFRQP